DEDDHLLGDGRAPDASGPGELTERAGRRIPDQLGGTGPDPDGLPVVEDAAQHRCGLPGPEGPHGVAADIDGEAGAGGQGGEAGGIAARPVRCKPTDDLLEVAL